MKYLVLSIQIMTACFMHPVTSFAGCEATYKQYNFLDMITGKITGDLFHCINDIMKTKETSSSSKSKSTKYSSSTSSPISSNRYLTPRLGQKDYKYYNYQLENEYKGFANNIKATTSGALISCH